MVEPREPVDLMSADELLERIIEETESLDNIYYGENVIAETPEIVKMSYKDFLDMRAKNTITIDKK